MTNNLITLTIPNDDHVALRAFGKALEEMALAHGAESVQRGICVNRITVHKPEDYAIPEDQIDALVRTGKEVVEKDIAELDTTAQQVESLSNKEWPKEQCPVTGAVHDVDPSEVPHSTLLEHGIDSTGTPWDERIHSASKALNSDGTWRLRRKPKDMDETEWSDYVTMIKADLQYPVECGGEESTLEEAVNVSIDAAHAGIAQEFGTGIANAVFTGDRVTPPGDDFHTDAGVVTEQTVAGIPPIPVPPPVVVPPVPEFDDGVPFPPSEGVSPALERLVEVTEQWTFPKLMKFLTERHGKIDVPTVNQLLAVDGLAALTDLNAHPDKIGPFVARVKAHLGE